MHVTYGGCGITFNGLLTIVLITLKLCGTISWSWIWVLCPLWVPIAFGLSLTLGFLLSCFGIYGFSGFHKTRRYY